MANVARLRGSFRDIRCANPGNSHALVPSPEAGSHRTGRTPGVAGHGHSHRAGGLAAPAAETQGDCRPAGDNAKAPARAATDRRAETRIEDLLNETRAGVCHEIDTTRGPERAFGLRVSPVTAGPEAGGHVIMIHELTEQRRDQARLEEHGRLAAVGQLAAGISHDFNNLLTSVIGHAEMLLIDGELDGDMLEDVTTIRDQGRRAAEMIQQILDFSRRSNPSQRAGRHAGGRSA